MKRVSLPYANSPLARLVDRRILELRGTKAQFAIASEAGFPQATMLANIKRGASRVPLDRVPGLAAALGLDPCRLFLLALGQCVGRHLSFQWIATTL
jgi:hypothetical protein